MAEEFHAAGVCGETWWNIPSKNMFSSPCSTGSINSDMGISCFGWGTTPTDQYLHQKPQQQQQADSGDCGGGSILIDSTLQMMGYGLSPSTTSGWNQSLLSTTRSNGRTTESYNSILQEDINSKSYTSPEEDSSITTSNKPMSNNQDNFPNLSAAFPMGISPSYGYPSTLLPSLFEPSASDINPQPQQLFNKRSINYMSATATASASAAATYEANANELSPSNSWPKLSPTIRPSLQKQHQLLPSSLHFSNNTPYWNASGTATTSINDVKVGFLPSPQSQFLLQAFEEKPNSPTLMTKTNNEEVRNSGSVIKKGSNEPPFKRPRIETTSPLPTFKVRKEKLGDRITALQQLVSPFGKTDTASVLHEAIEYIKFLHDQANVLCTPYMKQAAASMQQQQQQQQQSTDKMKEADEGHKQDLRSRGLCLVPMSSTFPFANETTADFWTPTFGGTFR